MKDAPWCGHCKSLAPQYSIAAKTLKDSGSSIKLAKVDATVETQLAGKYGVRGYPTLKFFRSGKDSEYAGGRTGPEIVAWLNKKTGPPAATIASVEDAEAFLADKEVAVIGFFKDVPQTFLDVAVNIDDIPFAIVSDDAVISHYEAKDGSIILFKKFDEGKNVFEGELTSEDLTSFVRKNSLSVVTEFGEETASKIFGGEIKIHNLLFVKKDSDDFKTIYDQFYAAATTFKGEVLFVLIDAAAESNSRILEYFGLGDEEVPTVRLITLDGDMKKYKPTVPELTTESLSQFVIDFKDGKLKPHLMSESVPEDWNANPVTILVGENFAEVALDPTKDVLVEFYAPWCGHCKQLAPIYEELGEHFKEREDVVIAKVDSTKNEVEDAVVRSFPTLKFWKKGENEMVDYSGDRTLEAMIQFVESGGEIIAEVDDEDMEEDEEIDEGAEDQAKDEL
ncbi:ER calcistorin isoform X1 [Strongylocentrotus purpuratus]|uniref:Protein disulfide-isomerase n=1 Tax=Strongylocentrotus purpuratus TaxID=7668 RepID=A0A7M7NQ17_STRPU|nr:ER calcistorin isoform X1 [Strongylocentrotus purpuratus]